MEIYVNDPKIVCYLVKNIYRQPLGIYDYLNTLNSFKCFKQMEFHYLNIHKYFPHLNTRNNYIWNI